MLIRSIAALALITSPAWAAPEVTGAYYFADRPFPQFTKMWNEGWPLKDDRGETVRYARDEMPLGGYAHIYFRNETGQALEVVDLKVEGIGLDRALAKSEDTVGDKHGRSILLSDLPEADLNRLKAAGHPVWWRPEPWTVPAGGCGEIVLRLRRAPTIDQVRVEIVFEEQTLAASVPVKKPQPRFESISFADDLSTVYLYPSRVGPTAPRTVSMNGADVTALAKIGWDKSHLVSPVVLKLEKPLEPLSYNEFRVEYEDGSAAVAGLRAFGHEMLYGMWGSVWGGSDPMQTAVNYLKDWAAHNINIHMGMGSPETRTLMRSEEGDALMTSLGMRSMQHWVHNVRDPLLYFLMDEPDSHDFAIDDLPPLERLGCLGQSVVERMREFTRIDAGTAILLNIDNTYKPENWYMYHQLSDIPCIDPYYPEQIDSAYFRHPGSFASHTKPTYVYAASAISQSSCRPKPLHVILCSTKYINRSLGQEGRFPTPEEKRMEVYYAVGAGAKGISYWWFSPDFECYGCGADDPAARELWREIGLLGAEVRTAGDVITASCPVELPITASRWVWARTLLSGLDTVAITVVNDDVLSDRVGTVVKPVENARLTVRVPSWLRPTDAFEVGYEGIGDVSHRQEGEDTIIELGRLNVSKFVLITSDPGLRDRLRKVYETRFADNVRGLTKQH